jgi:outer membrane protein assembly factor BamD (BamD/ComL family)
MNKIVVILFALTALAACQSPKEKALAEIKALEANDSIFSPQQIEKVKAAYIDFANKYPDDELAPEFLFKAGQRCNVTADHGRAIELFQQVINTYPKHKTAEDALFLQAYVYENSLQDYSKAKATYIQFIKQYPTSELVEDAKLSIQNMGKTPEEIFAEFDKKDSINTAMP